MIEIPGWATHVINFRTDLGEHGDGTEYAAYMEKSGLAAGGLRIMDLGDGRVALDESAIADLRKQPEDADGCIDEDGQCWISGMAWDVEPVSA